MGAEDRSCQQNAPASSAVRPTVTSGVTRAVTPDANAKTSDAVPPARDPDSIPAIS